MKIYMDSKPENCNHCIFNQSMSRHWDLEDYCLLNKKNRSKIIMDMDCPLKELEVRTQVTVAVDKAEKDYL